jgi:3D (Asp-Asp-Asp) domain-containing protein
MTTSLEGGIIIYMTKNENASLSLKKIACIALLLIFFFSVGVMASNVKVNNVKIVLSNNYEMNVLTTKTKISEILAENKIVILPEENIVPNLEAELSESRTITITKSSKEGENAIQLAEENSEVSIEQLLGDYTPVVEKLITEQVEVPYETITKDTSDNEEQTSSKVIQEGENGLKEITYKAKFKNDIEIERTILTEKIVREETNKIVQVNKNNVTSRSSITRTQNEKTTTTTKANTKDTSTLEKKVKGKSPVVKTLNTSAYCACASCCGKSTGITASGVKASSWYTVAAGKAYPVGTVIYIPALKNKPNGGWFVVQDRGGAISNSKLDIFMSSHGEATQYGRRNLECYIYM